MTKTTLFHIKTLTNLHVGSGDDNLGLVDKQVQRDPIEEIPVINASSLKGAIREHFERNELSKKKADIIFGHSDKDSANAGEVRFLQANLLALPARSNRELFFLATTPNILKTYIDTHRMLSDTVPKFTIPEIGQGVYISTKADECWVEDFEADSSLAKELAALSEVLFEGVPLALMDDETFKTLSLPVITRNKIAKDEKDDNNLFFEEVVPRHSLFYVHIMTPLDYHREDSEKLEKIFDEFISNLGTTIQIGANASIGYGLCAFSEVCYES